MSETSNYLGGSLGFALLGVVAAVVYRSRMDGTSDSLAGADAASLHVTGVVATVIFAGLAALTLTMRPATRTTRPYSPGYETTRS
jgi:DHA2 family multidrug resistance protein-like MFS transporter